MITYSNNRLTAEAAVLLAKGLQVNETLKVLKVCALVWFGFKFIG